MQFMGIVEDVGPEVKNVKKGDRVVACFDIGCGQCVRVRISGWPVHCGSAWANCQDC